MVRVLIADDEEVECAALEHMLEIHFPRVQVLPSVYDGRTMVCTAEKEKPDIIIVDINMPGMNGLEALKVLCDRSFEPAVIVHTAYNDFEYIHAALLMGAKNYLVKPVFEDDFVAAFYKVYTDVFRKKEMEETMTPGTLAGKLSRVSEKNIMMSLLLGTPDPAAWSLYKPAMHISTSGAGVCAVRWSDEAGTASLSSEFLFEVRQKCECLSILHQKILYCLLIPRGAYDRETYKDWLKKMLAETLTAFCRRKQLIFRAGCSSRKETAEGLVQAVQEADKALAECGENQICFANELEKKALPLFSEYVRPLAQDIREGKISFTEEDAVWNKILAEIRQRAVDDMAGFYVCVCAQQMILQSARQLHMDARLLGMDWTLQERLRGLITEILGEREQGEEVWAEVVGQLKAGLSVEELRRYLEREIRELQRDCLEPERKPNGYVETALAYLREHFNEPISLQTVAEAAGITQFYLSRLLKQEKDQTFPDLLTEQRMGRAIALMAREDIAVHEIGEAVGYTAKYFNQLFRSTFGISVREFREALLATCIAGR